MFCVASMARDLLQVHESLHWHECSLPASSTRGLEQTHSHAEGFQKDVDRKSSILRALTDACASDASLEERQLVSAVV